jgi:hypothetical protein
VRNAFFVLGLVATSGLAALAQDPTAAVLDEPAATVGNAATEIEAPPEAEVESEKEVASAAEEPAADEPASEPETDEADRPAEDAPAVEESEVSEESEEAEEAAAESAKTDWSGLFQRAPAFLALTHHAAVHLPIALWLFGALFVLVGLVVPSWRTQIPLACLIGGALTSVSAVASGWWYADYEYGEPWAWGDGFGDWSELLVQHRWLGFALALVSIGLSILALVSRARDSRRLGVVWRLGLILLALAVSWEGHIGGELIHGEGFLEEAFQEWVSPEPEE